MTKLPLVALGASDLKVTPICLGTMVFGSQVDEPTAHRIIDRALDSGINFMDTAEIYAVPISQEHYGKTEIIIGNYFAKQKNKRAKWIVATKVAGATTNNWLRGGKDDTTPADIAIACDDSLKRLQIDTIDLYQIHWPNRMVPMFGGIYYQPSKHDEKVTSIHQQLIALDRLVKAGKVRHIGLSNETPYGVHEFIRLAEQHGLARVVSVQNPYSLTSRFLDNALDETLHRLQVSLLAYSPLSFGVLTGKYDKAGLEGVKGARMTMYKQMREMRYARPQSMKVGALYNDLARQHNLTPTELALSFCYHRWSVASTIIGVATEQQLDEAISAYGVKLNDKILGAIDKIRGEHRDPAA